MLSVGGEFRGAEQGDMGRSGVYLVANLYKKITRFVTENGCQNGSVWGRILCSEARKKR